MHCPCVCKNHSGLSYWMHMARMFYYLSKYVEKIWEGLIAATASLQVVIDVSCL